ncbi:T9SS type A sorting domain-containing protein [Polaribacter sp.]|uniref:T9SS type A sorting domain-containing protein n=1 Tax=Polaribacter sp. TaxID=1920175 RepID=UPI0040481E2D
MKKILLHLSILLYAFTGLNAQTAPAAVCTSKVNYNFDEEITYYFDLTGNTSVTAGEDLYYYSWAPNTPPGGSVLMTYLEDMVWSLTYTPTEFYGLTVAQIEAEGDAAFWSNIQNANGTSVTGTIPYAQKELLRLGQSCTGVIVLSSESFNLDSINIYTINSSVLRIVGLTQEKINLKLYNLLGKQLLNTSFISKGADTISLPKLTGGVYIVQLENEKGRLSKKIIIE